MLQIGNVFKTSYWFYQPFIAVGYVKWVWIWVFLALVLLGLVARITRVYKRGLEAGKREVFRKLGNFGITMGLLGLLWFFFRQERVAFLAWRFWLILWLAISVVWIYKIIVYAFKKVPEINSQRAEKIIVEKYLPKSKR